MASEELSSTRPVGGRWAWPLADRKALGIATLLLGLGLVYFVGFAPLAEVHNAAHDTRHTTAFPCH